MKIRQAKVEDISRIIELLKQVNLVHAKNRPDIYKVTSKYQDDDLKKLIEDDHYYIIVADDNGLVKGYGIAVGKKVEDDPLFQNHKTLYIDDLCVDEAYRGQGIGSSLYAYYSTYALINGYNDVTLNVWSFNERAIHFYEKCGLKPQRIIMEQKLK